MIYFMLVVYFLMSTFVGAKYQKEFFDPNDAYDWTWSALCGLFWPLTFICSFFIRKWT